MSETNPLLDWSRLQEEVAYIEQKQLFFIGGAPRSGTTWLQQMLDCHPDVSCRGEAFFSKQLAVPLEGVIAQRCQALSEKNTRLFTHTGGYPLPSSGDTEFLIRTAILLALRQQSAGKSCLAIGEKTPENVFFFPRLKHLFTGAKFIAIARDPRDVLTSAWHFFHQPVSGEDEDTAKKSFIRDALPSLTESGRVMIELSKCYPTDYTMVTYESLRQTPAPILAELLGFLGVSSQNEIVEHCLTRTSFATLTGGRLAGEELRGAFFRKGVVGDWRSTLTPEMNDMVLRATGWMFPHFGWKI